MSDKKNIQTRKRIRHLGPSVAFLILALPHSPLLLLILSAVPVSTGGPHCRGGGGIAVAVAALALPLCGAHQRRRGRGRRGHRSPIRLSVPCPTLMRQSEARSPTYPSLVSSVRRLAPFLPFFLMSECPITLVSAPSFLSGRRRRLRRRVFCPTKIDGRRQHSRPSNRPSAILAILKEFAQFRFFFLLLGIHVYVGNLF